MNASLRKINLGQTLTGIMNQRGAIFGFMIFGALLAFEIFNYTTTQFALHDVLGDLTFMKLEWATILALAFCGIDFAGIARIFTPEQGRDEPAEVWYLFGAWFLAAVMNAMLTWWGVSVAIAERGAVQGTAVVSSSTLTTVVPVFVALMVLVIRVLIIGTFSSMGDRLFHGNTHSARRPMQNSSVPVRPATLSQSRPMTNTPQTYRAASPRPQPRPESNYSRSEPTYHNVHTASTANNDKRYVE
jgi:hypothetical protein